MFFGDRWHDTPFFDRDALRPQDTIAGPAVIRERNTTIVIEPGWRAEVTPLNHLMLRRVQPLQRASAIGTRVDPVLLEVFNNLFMSIAEQMGVTLANTATSVNIKERLDFSCALFDAQGNLIANAPHMPVHLGSMGESVQEIMRRRGDDDAAGRRVRAERAVRGRHAPAGRHGGDAGVPGSANQCLPSSSPRAAITPTSAASRRARCLPTLRTSTRKACCSTTCSSSRRASSSKASCARCSRAASIRRATSSRISPTCARRSRPVRRARPSCAAMVEHFGLPVVQAYMQHVQDNAEEAVRRVIDALTDGDFEYAMDNGARVRVAIRIDKQARAARIDFTGTSAQQPNNFNAPVSGHARRGAVRVPHAGE